MTSIVVAMWIVRRRTETHSVTVKKRKIDFMTRGTVIIFSIFILTIRIMNGM